MPLEDDDLDALNAPLRPGEHRWDESTVFVVSDDLGFTGPYVAGLSVPGPAVA